VRDIRFASTASERRDRRRIVNSPLGLMVDQAEESSAPETFWPVKTLIQSDAHNAWQSFTPRVLMAAAAAIQIAAPAAARPNLSEGKRSIAHCRCSARACAARLNSLPFSPALTWLQNKFIHGGFLETRLSHCPGVSGKFCGDSQRVWVVQCKSQRGDVQDEEVGRGFPRSFVRHDSIFANF
jgi:hypothetical protein